MIRFLHPPRTGGFSIVLSWNIGKPEYRGHDGPRPDDGWRYGFVRDPWDRVGSMYRALHHGGMDFTEWLLSGMGGLRPEVRGPCARWLREADWTGRFERRAEDLVRLAGLLGRRVPPHWIHRTTGGDHRDLYDDERAVRWVAQEFAADIDLYGYRFEGVAT